MKKKIKKNQKPIDYDIHLKYICKKCNNLFWLSFKETSTKNFKIVCDCGNVFGVKRTLDLKISYIKSKPKKLEIKEKSKIPFDLLEKSVTILTGYGFTKQEASELIIASYGDNPQNNITLLVKQTLETLRNKNVNECNSSIQV